MGYRVHSPVPFPLPLAPSQANPEQFLQAKEITNFKRARWLPPLTPQALLAVDVLPPSIRTETYAKRLAMHLRPHIWDTSDVVLTQGQALDCLIFVQSGRAESMAQPKHVYEAGVLVLFCKARADLWGSAFSALSLQGACAALCLPFFGSTMKRSVMVLPSSVPPPSPSSETRLIHVDPPFKPGGFLRNQISWPGLEPPPPPFRLLRGGGGLRAFNDASLPLSLMMSVVTQFVIPD